MSILLAKIFGIYFLALGLAFFINLEGFKSIYKQVTKNEPFLLLGAVLALLIGAVIVSLHNVWALDWPVIITIIGWWSLIKGFALLASSNFIKFFSFMENRSNLFYHGISFFYSILGIFLLYKGWYV